MATSISFIIPVYNTPEELFRRCLESILALPEEIEYEIIVVDDGSKNDISGIVRSYNDSRINFFRQDNRGQAAARNTGLSAASKDYIQFIDSDDYLITDSYVKILDLLADKPDLLIFRYKRVRGLQPVRHRGCGRIVWCGSGADYMSERSILGVVWNSLVRRTTLGCLSFHEGILHEDEEYAPLMILRAEKMLVTSMIGYAYYRSDGSTMTERDPRHIARRFDDLCTVIDALKEYGVRLTGKEKEALARRIAQLQQSFAYEIVRLSPDKAFFNRSLNMLFEKNYLPLPKRKYNWKYSLSRRLTHSRNAMKIAYLFRFLL